MKKAWEGNKIHPDEEKHTYPQKDGPTCKGPLKFLSCSNMCVHLFKNIAANILVQGLVISGALSITQLWRHTCAPEGVLSHKMSIIVPAQNTWPLYWSLELFLPLMILPSSFLPNDHDQLLPKPGFKNRTVYMWVGQVKGWLSITLGRGGAVWQEEPYLRAGGSEQVRPSSNVSVCPSVKGDQPSLSSSLAEVRHHTVTWGLMGTVRGQQQELAAMLPESDRYTGSWCISSRRGRRKDKNLIKTCMAPTHSP